MHRHAGGISSQIFARLRWQLLVFGCLLPLDDQWIRAAKHQRRSKIKQSYQFKSEQLKFVIVYRWNSGWTHRGVDGEREMLALLNLLHCVRRLGVLKFGVLNWRTFLWSVTLASTSTSNEAWMRPLFGSGPVEVLCMLALRWEIPWLWKRDSDCRNSIGIQ